MATHTATRALTGVEGYRRLARLIARAFYSGECPPPELDTAKEADASPPPAAKSKLPKVRFIAVT